MDRELFVQNIEWYCAQKGEKPTNVCRDSGVGTSFLTDIKRGKTPSVAKVQQLAQYLGCTTSDLLGETGRATQTIDERFQPFVDLFASLGDSAQTDVVGFMLKKKNQK